MGNALASLWTALIAVATSVTTYANALNRSAKVVDNLTAVAEQASEKYLKSETLKNAAELRQLERDLAALEPQQ